MDDLVHTVLNAEQWKRLRKSETTGAVNAFTDATAMTLGLRGRGEVLMKFAHGELPDGVSDTLSKLLERDRHAEVDGAPPPKPKPVDRVAVDHTAMEAVRKRVDLLKGLDGNVDETLDKLILSDPTCRELWGIAQRYRGMTPARALRKCRGASAEHRILKSWANGQETV